MKQYLLALLVIAAALAGCDEIVYKIELKPKGDKIIRTLTAWRISANSPEGKKLKSLDAAELKSIAKAYSEAIPGDDVKKPTFTGTFNGVMLNDVGGAGRYNRFESKMGIASSYIERFRGNDRPGEVIEASLKAVDEFTDIMIGFLESQMGAKPGFAELRKFMDTELRKDLKNLSVYTYMLSNPSRLSWLGVDKDKQEIQQAETLGRAASYLIEREYIKPAQLPLFRRHVTSGKDPKAGLQLILQSLEAKAKIPNKKLMPHLAALLTDETRMQAAFNKYLMTTPQYKKAIKERKPSAGDGPTSRPGPSPESLVIEPLLKKAVHFNIEFGSRRLDLQLAMPREPDATNGKGNPKEGAVTWNGRLTDRGKETTVLPEICYAVWSEPNEKFQTAKFGKVMLIGKDLMDYCLWRKGLTDREAKIWDKAIADHKPGKDLDATIRTSLGSDKTPGYLSDGLKLLQTDKKPKSD